MSVLGSPRWRISIAVASLILAAVGCTAEDADAPPVAETPAEQSPAPTDATPSPSPRPGQGPSTKARLRVVGHHPLGGAGYNADVYGFGDFAYVGTYARPSCRGGGVKAIDISNPKKPKLASVLQNPDNTSAEDVVIKSAVTAKFEGDLLVTGLQVCGEDATVQGGLLFFDVTNPHRPKKLGAWEAPAGTPGCHEIDMAVRSTRGKKDRLLAACADPFAHQNTGEHEVFMVDASNPRSPRQVGGFSLPPERTSGPAGRYGCVAVSYAHSVRFFNNAKDLYVSYWDAGTLLLKVDDPSRPRLVGTTHLGAHSEDGDNHSMTLADKGRLLLIASEDLSPGPEVFIKGLHCPTGPKDEWGQLFLYDNSNPRKTRFLSSFGTPRSKGGGRNGGVYPIHNIEVVGSQAFASWYSDGVRWLDLSNPKKPKEMAHFLPPRMKDPHGHLPPSPQVWGVWPLPEKELVLASDMNSGLWILRPVGLDGT